jgi:hypothetical protein
MSDLNKIFIENLDGLEEEPLAGHFERFNEKLLKKERKRRLNIPFLKVAAVFVFVLLSANLYIYFRIQKTDDQNPASQKNEMQEAGLYYNNQITNDINEIEKMAKEGIGSEKEVVQVKKELSEMDSLFQNLEQDYKSNPDDERILNAMIEYYQAKLNIVNTIKTDLEDVKQQKIKYHENAKS